MKANEDEAPEKIYVHKSQYWGLMANYKNITKNDIEYIRKDAFIEKVANYLNYILYDRVEIKNPGSIIPSLCAKGEFIEDFKNYMKGISYDVQNV